MHLKESLFVMDDRQNRNLLIYSVNRVVEKINIKHIPHFSLPLAGL
jgi:hypothetical protein